MYFVVKPLCAVMEGVLCEARICRMLKEHADIQ